MPGLEFEGCKFDRCDVGVEVSKGASAKFVDTDFIDCQKGAVERDPQSLIEKLGIPPAVPHEYIGELFLALTKTKYQKREVVIKKSRFWECVKNMQSAATLLKTILGLSPEVIRLVKQTFT